MLSLRWLIVAALLAATACQCGGPKTMTVDECIKNPESCVDASVPDAAVDAGEIDAGVDAGLPACTNLGSVSGRVCATDRRTWVVGARVSVTTTDCNGQPVTVEAQSDADGRFQLNDVPSGRQTVRAETGSFVQELGVTVARGQNSPIAESQLCVEQKNVRIAVVTGIGDRIEDLLTSLNLTFTSFDGTTAGWPSSGAVMMSNLATMKEYDIIFVNCAAARTGGSISFGADAVNIERNLRDYVAQGGNLYASDWGALFVHAASPSSFGFLTSTGNPVANPLVTNHLMGYAPQTVTAKIASGELAAFLGKTSVPIDFPRETGAISLHWGLMQDVTAAAEVLVSTQVAQTCGNASCSTQGMPAYNIPLAASVRVPNGGRVVYTSFHNIGQPGNDVAQILKFLILKL